MIPNTRITRSLAMSFTLAGAVACSSTPASDIGPDASPSAPNADATVVNDGQAEDEQADDAGLDANAACPEAEAFGADGAS